MSQYNQNPYSPQNPYPQHRPVYAVPLKDVGVAYLFGLATIIGVAGLQHFYLGKPLRGVIWLLTWGLLGIGTIIDLFTLPAQTRAVNARLQYGIR